MWSSYINPSEIDISTGLSCSPLEATIDNLLHVVNLHDFTQFT